MGSVFKLRNKQTPGERSLKVVWGESDRGGQVSRAAELWKQLDLQPEWPVFVTVMARRRSCRGVGRRLALCTEGCSQGNVSVLSSGEAGQA